MTTGTSSIQAALERRRESLRSQGVVYPRMREHRSHDVLATPFNVASPAGWPNQAVGSPVERRDLAARRLGQVAAQFVQSGCSTLVLSSDHLFRASDPGALHQVVRDLVPDLDGITIVVYLRRPSSLLGWLLADAAQSGRPIRAHRPPPMAPRLASWARIGRLVATEFHPAVLHDGDVVADFEQRTGIDLGAASEVARDDQPLSAEACQLLQAYRQVHNGPEPADVRGAMQSYRRTLRDAEPATSTPASEPELVPEFADFIDHGHSDLLEVRREVGLTFRNVDYDRVGSDVANEWADCRWIRDVLQVDEDRLEELRSLAPLPTDPPGTGLAGTADDQPDPSQQASGSDGQQPESDEQRSGAAQELSVHRILAHARAGQARALAGLLLGTSDQVAATEASLARAQATIDELQATLYEARESARDLRRDFESLRRTQDQLSRELAAANDDLAAVRASTSWRLTAPLRAVTRRLRSVVQRS